MIEEKALPELSVYRRLERSLPIEYVPELSDLVVPNINENLPVHRWFRFKEGFSADLLRTILLSLRPGIGKKNICVADPFCGVATSLVSAQELRDFSITAIGIERNPFIHFIAKTKVAWPLIDPERLLRTGEEILIRSGRLLGRATMPTLSGFTTERCMSRHNTLRLRSIRDAIREDGDSPTHDALLLGMSAAVEQLSKTRKDGRALRLVEKNRQRIDKVLSKKWTQIASDVRFMQQVNEQRHVPLVLLGDGRFPESSGLRRSSIDLLVTSPPYPNNIDYSEVYKLELWLLGFVNDAKDFLKLRKSTFRSHPTAAEVGTDEDFDSELRKGMLRSVLRPIIRRTESSTERYRHRLVLGYAFDLWTTLREYHSFLKSGGLCVFVVGNSLHGGKHLPYLIPTV